MTDKPAPATDEEIKRAEMDWDFWSRDSFRSSMIARIRAEQERVRVLMSDTLTYRERIRELEAENKALNDEALRHIKQRNDDLAYRQKWTTEIDTLRAEEKRLGEIIEQRDVDCAKILAERDEARATKDMHKERQEEYLAEVARLRETLREICGVHGWSASARAALRESKG